MSGTAAGQSAFPSKIAHDVKDFGHKPLSGETIIELLFELNQEQGTTLVLVTHDQMLAKACQRHFQLDHGELSEAILSGL